MMKRTVIAAFLLCCAIFVSIWSGAVFKSSLTKTSNELYRLTEISQTVSDEELLSETEKVLAEWNSTSKLLHTFVMHKEMDVLEQNITALPMTVKHLNRERFRINCIEAINQIKNLLDCAKINIENIL